MLCMGQSMFGLFSDGGPVWGVAGFIEAIDVLVGSRLPSSVLGEGEYPFVHCLNSHDSLTLLSLSRSLNNSSQPFRR